MGRGMKKWAPYKALTEQYESLYTLEKAKSRIEKPIISSDKAEEINYILQNYSGETLIFDIYKKGEVITLTSPIVKFDLNNRCLICENNIKILLQDIIDVEQL